MAGMTDAEFRQLIKLLRSANKPFGISPRQRERLALVICENKTLLAEISTHTAAHTLLLSAMRMLKERNRQPAQETVERDRKLYELRNQDAKVWTWARLAKEFGISKAACRQSYGRHLERLKGGK